MTPQPTSHPLRFWQIRIRDVLAFTLICALALGWWCDRKRLQGQLAARNQSAAEERSLAEKRYQELNDIRLREVVELQDRLAQVETERPRSWRMRALLPGWTSPVTGVIRTVKRAEDGTLVEISLGKDDGLEVGTKLDVFRLGAGADGGQFLGRIKVIRTEPDLSTAELLVEKTPGSIQRWDHVGATLPIRSP